MRPVDKPPFPSGFIINRAVPNLSTRVNRAVTETNSKDEKVVKTLDPRKIDINTVKETLFREHRSITNTDDNLENNLNVDKDGTRTKREAEP